MADFTLTKENYYTREADVAYMSCSQYDSFMGCEAKTMADLKGVIPRRETSFRPFIIGHYFHTAMEGDQEHAEWIEEHWNDVYKTGKRVKEDDIVLCDKMIKAANEDANIAKLIALPGDTEIVMSGAMFDVIPWKVRFDKYSTSPRRVIIDWKTVGDINERMWDKAKHEYVSFIRYWGYDRRAATYIEIEKQVSGETTDASFPLVCISKEDPPNKAIFVMNDPYELEAALASMKENALRFYDIKRGLIPPKRCGHCAYCRSTQTTAEPQLFTVLDPGREAI